MRFIARCFVPSDCTLLSDHRPVICELNFRPRTTPKTIKNSPPLDIRSLSQDHVKEAFQREISSALGDTDPDTLPSEELAATIRSVANDSAQRVIPAKPKNKFPEEFSAETIDLIHRKRKLWKFMQKSGVRVTRSSREKYRTICRETKHAIKNDRNLKLEREAAGLSEAFRQNIFAGYSLLKR